MQLYHSHCAPLRVLVVGGASHLPLHRLQTPASNQHTPGSPGLTPRPAHPRQHGGRHGVQQGEASQVHSLFSAMFVENVCLFEILLLMLTS